MSVNANSELVESMNTLLEEIKSARKSADVGDAELAAENKTHTEGADSRDQTQQVRDDVGDKSVENIAETDAAAAAAKQKAQQAAKDPKVRDEDTPPEKPVNDENVPLPDEQEKFKNTDGYHKAAALETELLNVLKAARDQEPDESTAEVKAAKADKQKAEPEKTESVIDLESIKAAVAANKEQEEAGYKLAEATAEVARLQASVLDKVAQAIKQGQDDAAMLAGEAPGADAAVDSLIQDVAGKMVAGEPLAPEEEPVAAAIEEAISMAEGGGETTTGADQVVADISQKAESGAPLSPEEAAIADEIAGAMESGALPEGGAAPEALAGAEAGADVDTLADQAIADVVDKVDQGVPLSEVEEVVAKAIVDAAQEAAQAAGSPAEAPAEAPAEGPTEEEPTEEELQVAANAPLPTVKQAEALMRGYAIKAAKEYAERGISKEASNELIREHLSRALDQDIARGFQTGQVSAALDLIRLRS